MLYPQGHSRTGKHTYPGGQWIRVQIRSPGKDRNSGMKVTLRAFQMQVQTGSIHLKKQSYYAKPSFVHAIRTFIRPLARGRK